MNPETLGILTGAFLIVGLPAIAILTNHQRKMAELMHRQAEVPANQPSQDARLIVQELRLMRSEMASLTIAVDNMKDTQELSHRLAANQSRIDLQNG